MSDSTETKLFASLLLLLLTLIFGYLPVYLFHKLNRNVILFMFYFGGGVLIAAAFCHLIPEAHDSYLKAGHKDDKSCNQNCLLTHSSDCCSDHSHKHIRQASAFPYVELCLCGGFFFMLIIEQITSSLIGSHKHHNHSQNHDENFVPLEGLNQDQKEVTTISDQMTTDVQLEIPPTGQASVLEGREMTSGRLHLYKFIRGFIVISSFGLHSIFDGVAIGSPETKKSIWTVFLAISCHKLIIALVVGLEVYEKTLNSRLWTLIHMFIFSILSPIGIILVILAQTSLSISAHDPTMALLQSFATGTILYIIFVEVLQAEGNGRISKMNTFSLIIGFTFMFLILNQVGHGECD